MRDRKQTASCVQILILPFISFVIPVSFDHIKPLFPL